MRPAKFVIGDYVSLSNDPHTLGFLKAMEYWGTPATELEGTHLVVSTKFDAKGDQWMIAFELPTPEAETWFDEKLFQLAKPSASSVSSTIH